jgi:hypothetical protein
MAAALRGGLSAAVRDHKWPHGTMECTLDSTELR